MASMFWRKIGKGICLAAICASSGIASASADTAVFLNSGQLKVQIERFASSYPDRLKILEIGKTINDKHLYVLRIGSGDSQAPAVLALFGQQADEHETTNLALGLARTLLDKADNDTAFADLLGRVTVYLAPMVNPDGADYDLMNPGFNPTWRKNRSPQSDWQFGVNLNHNWGAFWDAPSGTRSLSSAIRDPASHEYRGPTAFSEHETQALRSFVFRNASIRMLLDYSTSTAGFMQGAILLPYSYGGKTVPVANGLCAEHLPDSLAAAVSNLQDSRKGFRAVQANRMKELMVEQTPALVKPFTWATTSDSTAASGTAIDWGASNGKCSMAIVTALTQPKPSLQEESRLIQDQSRGMLLLLESIAPHQ